MSAERDPTPANRFADLACLTYAGNDGPARREQAAALLPGALQVDSVPAAAAAADVDRLRALLDADPAAASRAAGPRGWAPLVYLCYSRVTAPGGDPLAAARLLLDRGADPNSYTTITECRFTALTGVIGEGEGGLVAQPPHPQAMALAALLLDRGADPNDSQALYNTHFTPDDRWLRLLIDRGLTSAMTVNWGAPGQEKILDFVLGQAVRQGFAARVALLLAHGADAGGRNHYNQRTHLENALLEGQPAIAALLRQHGAGVPHLTGEEQLRAAVLIGDEADARRLLALHPGALAAGGVLGVAADHGNLTAVQLALALGAPAGGAGRDGLTPLHRAARAGQRAVAEMLVAAGAPFDRRDPIYGGTPLDHARHFAQASPTPALTEVRDWLLAHTTDPFDLVNHDRARLAARAATDADAARVQADVEAIERAYRAFNARDLEGAVAGLHPDVDWPNVAAGTRLRGRDQVRAYWSAQWQVLDPKVEPAFFRPDVQGRIVVEVHQVVRDLTGAVLVDQRVGHAFVLDGGLGRRMDIVPA
jgi:hypothetical protein